MKPTTIERFESKFVRGPADECWLWTAATGGSGYGIFSDGGRLTGAHRFSYKTHVGPIPSGMHVLHHCDTRLCVNPSHLFLGTHADNAADMVSKNRQVQGDSHWSRTQPEKLVRGDRHGRAKLTEAQVVEILSIHGEPQAQIAKRFGVSFWQINRIRNGTSWSHIPQPQPPEAAP